MYIFNIKIFIITIIFYDHDVFEDQIDKKNCKY